MFDEYLERISSVFNQGDAREESYYHVLKDLLEKFSLNRKKDNAFVTVLPRSTEAGNPDFRVWDGKQKIVGYIEAKSPFADLGKIERTEQLKRYINTFPNVILTNFLEFRLYRNGTRIQKVVLAFEDILEFEQVPPVQDCEGMEVLLDRFLSFSLPRICNAKTLAVELAKRTRFLRDEVIFEELKEKKLKSGDQKESGDILGFYKAFKKFLISDLNEADFADLYAQTITYGLFAARTRTNGEFNRKLAYDLIPKSIGILRDIFKFISLGNIPKQMEWSVDDIAEVLTITNVNKILDTFYKRGKGSDPVIHFYETFLSEYDQETRASKGVYYTPEPVVSYIVESINEMLKKMFNISEGFANEKVTVLDPSAGTMTFMAKAAQLAVKEYVRNYGEGGVPTFIKEHILKNFYAFELMMAPYAIGHMKISFFLEELGYKIDDDERFQLYLTNTLEMEEFGQTDLPGTASLSKESHLAEKVKKDVPILIILGNPPYAGHSTNNSEWISKEIEEYYKVNGQALKEKNTKWLQDDYVKFIRFAQWKIDKVGSGIIGFVTNHSFIDSPTFRGMRQSLKDSFEYIYVIDLHGNSRKNERCPDGSKDENVFDIQQGVSILFLIKTCNCKNHYSVKHADLWGVREEKYNWLSSNSVNTTDWSEVEPIKPYYYFSPFNNAKLGEYLKFARIKDIFPINSVGIVTARDKFTVEYDSEKLYRKLKDFVSLDTETARLLYDLGNDTSDWKVHLAQKDLIDSGLKRENILNIMYRPFDIRYTYYTGNSKRFHCRPRPKVMKNMIRKNIALLTTRQVNNDFHHVFCSDKLTDFCALSTKTKENTYVFPLYIYTDEQNKMFNEEKKPNINRNFQNSLIQTFCHEVTPQEIFYYSYAMLFSNSYRNKYDEFLRRDFPRIPFTSDYKLFCKLVNIGRELVNIHLLKTTECSTPNAKFQGLGNQRVDKINYSVEEKKVFINSKQYFEGLSRSVWEYEIGSYQVCEKWLKSRKGRILRNEEIKSYCQMVKVINTTIELQRKIDSIYSLAKQSFLDFS